MSVPPLSEDSKRVQELSDRVAAERYRRRRKIWLLVGLYLVVTMHVTVLFAMLAFHNFWALPAGMAATAVVGFVAWLIRRA